MISPLQNLQALQTILTVEQQLLANILQNLAPAGEQMQQPAGQTGTADNLPQTPPLPCPSTSPVRQLFGGRGEGLRERVIPKGSEGEVKESGESLLTKTNDQAPSLKEQIVSLTQALVQNGHLPSSTLTQPIPVIIPQMLACLGKLHREEKKKKQKKKKNRDKKGNQEDQEDQNESPLDMLIRQVFKMHSPSK
ncbi:MAG: hypothetical protein HYU99_00635 [Deltaproteobacteria bacterium]|nr:hypothetical protein [Deltaproteobacteria bacterium]